MREHAPNIVYEPGERQLPVDFRECRAVRCAAAPDDRDLDVHRTDAGRPATAFTRVDPSRRQHLPPVLALLPRLELDVRGLGPAVEAGRRLGDWPGCHDDDWEGYQVRLDRRAGARVRSTSHGHYQWCKQAECRDRWGPRTGWTRVSRGSHAGHIPLDARGLRRPARGGGADAAEAAEGPLPRPHPRA